MTDGIYLDNAATTRMSGEVLDAMLPYLRGEFGNPESRHAVGRVAASAVETARTKVSRLIGARPDEIYLTSGGAESDTWALRSLMLGPRARGRHLIVSSVEHHAVLNAAEYLKGFGVEVTVLPVDSRGMVDPDIVERSIRPDTGLISVMTANNEVGTIEPIREIGEVAAENGVLFHTDAVQACGHMPVDVDDLNVDLLSASAHKFGGPKGTGFLYVKRGLSIDPLVNGGSQERGIRGGTTNVAGAVGMGKAAEISMRGPAARVTHLTALRNRLVEDVLAIPGASLTGHPVKRLPGHASFVIAGVSGDALTSALSRRGVYASSVSACAAGETHVLAAMGYSSEKALGALRLTLSEDLREEDLDRAAGIIGEEVARLRGLSPRMPSDGWGRRTL